MASDSTGLPTDVCSAAASTLSDRFGRRIALHGHEVLNVGHAVVARLHLDGTHLDGTPMSSVILKLAKRDDHGNFEATDPNGPAALLWNEWGGLMYASARTRVVPEFYGGDRDLGFLLFEDLGNGPNLANVLLGNDESAARRALLGFVDAVADLHLETFGQSESYDSVRRKLGQAKSRRESLGDDAFPTLLATLHQLDPGAYVGKAVEETVARLDSIVLNPGRWGAFSPNDCCPDNNKVYEDGSVRLFDLEFCDFHHALLDLAYLRTTMATCWCVRRLPTELADSLIEHYRSRLLDANAPVDMDEFDAALAACQAWWAISVTSHHLEPAFGSDGDQQRYFANYDFTGISWRQRTMLRMDELTDAARRRPELAPLQQLATAIRTAAIKSWGSYDPLPLYPALDGN